MMVNVIPGKARNLFWRWSYWCCWRFLPLVEMTKCWFKFFCNRLTW